MTVIDRIGAFVILLIVAWLALWLFLALPSSWEFETKMAIAALYVLKGTAAIVAGISFLAAFGALIGKLDG